MHRSHFAPKRSGTLGRQAPQAQRKELKSLVYKEHAAVAHMAADEAAQYRGSHEMSVEGTDIPNPILSVTHVDLPHEILSLLERNGITTPTPIQAQGWPIALSGRNMVGIAQTGSGKTLSFLLPAFRYIQTQKGRDRAAVPYALVLAPTRELACQIEEVAVKYGRPLGIVSACVYGGAPRRDQAYKLRNGIDLLVATPGRLIDFLTSGELSLINCGFVVLDEADRMLDMGFEPQLRDILPSTRPDRQTLMWSATWPREVQNLADDILGTNIIRIRVGSDALTANKKITQNMVVCTNREKEKLFVDTLLQLYDTSQEQSLPFPKTIVFVNTKRQVDELTEKLRRDNWPTGALHGDKSQDERQRTLRSFRHGKFSVLVATEVAARGLDIDDIGAVINYDFPKNTEDYVHRIGRTARGNAQEGTAYTFFTSENAASAKDLVRLLRRCEQAVPSEILDMAHQRGSGGSRRPVGRGNRGGASSGSRGYRDSRGGSAGYRKW